MSYTNGLDNPELYFQTKLYTGNGGTQSITFDGSENMQPDWVWIKARNATRNSRLTDSINGVQKNLFSDLTNALTTNYDGVTAFGTNGFSVGSGNGFNGNSETHVAWNWKASGTSISNSSGSNGATLASAGIKNDTAGISIVTYTGDGNARTVFHGLSSCDMVIHKCLNNAENWGVQHKDIGAAYQLQLDTTIAKVDKSGNGSMALPAANVFSVNNSGQWGAARNYIAYAFRSVKSYSKIGSYTGNSNVNGTYVHLGFKPAFLMVKRTDATYRWTISTNKILGYNRIINQIAANSNAAENTSASYGEFDFTANGFKCRSAEDGMNVGNIIYMAFAESPFTNSSGVPNNAR